MNSLELGVYDRINHYRQSLNLPTLGIDPIVSAQARAHSEEMARTGNYKHRVESSAPKLAYPIAAENIATSRGYRQPDLNRNIDPIVIINRDKASRVKYRGEPIMNRNKLSLLLAIVTILSTGLPASAELGPGEVNLIGIGVNFLTNLINPPHRVAEINAEVEIKKAKMAADIDIEREKLRIAATADRVSPVLAKWGVNRANCAPGLVFINGIDANAHTVCVQPNQTIAPGYYTYNHEQGVLLRTSGAVTRPSQNHPASTRLTATENTSDKGF